MQVLVPLSFALLSVTLSAQNIIVRNVTVVDTTRGEARPNSTVAIAAGKIVAVSGLPGVPAAPPRARARRRPARLAVPANSTTVDGKGKFLIPGLWDMHVHLQPKQPMLNLYVANGVVGIRDMGSELESTKRWRAEVEAGKQVGPRIITSGPAVNGPTAEPAKFPVITAATPNAARSAADQLDGPMMVDFIKVLSTLSRDAYQSLAQRARLRRAVVAGHVPESMSVWEAIDARQRSMEHLFGIAIACSPEERTLRFERAQAIAKQDGAELRRIRQRTYETYSEARALELFGRMARYGVWQTPTLTLRQRLSLLNLDQLVSNPAVQQVPREVVAGWTDPRDDLKKATPETIDNLREDYDRHAALVPVMRRAGVELLAGTDTGDPYVVPGAALHDELELLVKSGITPLDSLRAATIHPARYLNQEESQGTVAPGQVADLVLLDANPLDDIRNTRRISAVILRGKLLDRKRLDALASHGPDVK